jgi:hypothetical protein
MQLFVVSFAPFQDRASVGGFDWFYKEEMAYEAFDSEVKENGNTHDIRLFPFVSSFSNPEEITHEIGSCILDLEETLVPLKQHLPE